MRGVAIGMQERDGDGADACFGYLARNPGDGLLVERRFLAAVPAPPPLDPVAPVTGHQHRLGRRLQRVGLAADMPADLQHIGKAPVGDQRAFRQLALQHGIGGDGRAMQDEPDLPRLEAEAFFCFGYAGEQPLGGIRRRGRGLERMDFAGLGIQHHQVREGAPDIDADAVSRSRIRHISF